MGKRNVRDMVVGALLCSLGIFVAWYCHRHYPIGLRGSMGSGTFPFAISIILAGLGLYIMIDGFVRSGVVKVERIDYPALAFVMMSLAAFAFLSERAGLLPSVAVLTIIAIPAKAWRGWRFALLLSMSLCITAAVVFRIGLAMPFRLVWWE